MLILSDIFSNTRERPRSHRSGVFFCDQWTLTSFLPTDNMSYSVSFFKYTVSYGSILVSAVGKAAAQGKAVPLYKLLIILLPGVVTHLPPPEPVLLSLLIPVQIHRIRVGEVRMPFPGVLIVREQFGVKSAAVHLGKPGVQIFIAVNIIRHSTHL